MYYLKRISWLLTVILVLSSCEVLNKVEMPVKPGDPGLTDSEVSDGLKEALDVGTKNAVKDLSKKDALYKNPELKIPFPEEANVVANKLRQMGMGDLVDKFVRKMNHGAEKAMNKAKPVFIDAIKQMTIKDAWNILRGPDNAATKYFRKKTSDKLYKLFKPEIKETLDEIHVTKVWEEVMTAYNKLPFDKEVNSDLPDYVTKKALDRLFEQIAKEELKIREKPVARVTELLKRVFSQQD